jgi:TonB-linked SusC/RagA family outer membrane protein
MRRIYNERLNKRYTVYRYDESTSEYSEVSTVNNQPSYLKQYINNGDDPQLRVLSRFYLNYDRAFNDHQIGALVFIEREDNEVNTLSALRRELLSDNVPTIIAGDDALTTSGGNGLPIEYTRISLASRLNYAYKSKYLLEATLRADASSKFSPQVRWGYFPSVSAGWNIAMEDFMAEKPFSELKLRASYSQTGRDNVVSNTAFDYLTGFEELGSVYYLDGVPVTQILTTGLVNQFLTWEKVTLFNAGLDFSVFRNKLYGNVDAFFRIRDGIFGPAVEDIPSTFGADLPLVNINSTTNRGFEFLVGYRDKTQGGLQYDLSANFTLTREKYRDWQENIDFNDPNQVRIDQRTGNYVNRSFGYISDGLINSQAELENYVSGLTFETLNGQPMIGDIRYVDVSGPNGTPDGVINRYDIRQIGFGDQPDVTFGLNSQLNYKNFSLLMIWQGASMFNVNASGNIFRNPFDNEAVPVTLHTKYSWTQDPQNPGVGNNPNAALPTYNNDGGRIWNNNFSDFWVRNGTYLRFKTATVSYRLGAKSMSSIGMRSAEIYLTGDNLFSFNNLGIYNEAIDPEQAYNNGGYSIPLLRSFTAGLRLGF